MKQEMR